MRVRMAAGVDVAKGVDVDVDVGVDLRGFHARVAGHLMLPAGRTFSAQPLTRLFMSLHFIPGRSGCVRPVAVHVGRAGVAEEVAGAGSGL